jgi:hypothetical protein
VTHGSTTKGTVVALSVDTGGELYLYTPLNPPTGIHQIPFEVPELDTATFYAQAVFFAVHKATLRLLPRIPHL